MVSFYGKIVRKQNVYMKWNWDFGKLVHHRLLLLKKSRVEVKSELAVL